MNSFWQKNRPILGQPLSLTFALTLAILFALISGLAGVRTVRQWREEIIDRNMALTAQASRDLAASAGDYFCGLPRAGSSADPAGHEAADLQLTLLATQVFTTSTGLKGGFWVISENEFMGYANPWSPPPAPAFGPPPRSHTIILDQVRETIRTKNPSSVSTSSNRCPCRDPSFPSPPNRSCATDRWSRWPGRASTSSVNCRPPAWAATSTPPPWSRCSPSCWSWSRLCSSAGRSAA